MASDQQLIPRPPQIPAEIDNLGHYYSSAQEELHLRDYWKIVVKRRRLVFVVVGILLGFGVYFNYTATPMYTAKSVLKVEPNNPVVTGVGQMMPSESAAGGEYFQTQLVLLRSRSLASRVITDLGLKNNAIFTSAPLVGSNVVRRLRVWVLTPVRFLLAFPSWFKRGDPNTSAASKVSQQQPNSGVDSALMDRYAGFVDVQPVKGTRLVEIVATTPEPTLSQQLADEHGAAFIRMNRETRFNLTKEALTFLDTKNAELKEKLEKSEHALNNFRQQFGVVSLDKGENVFVDRLMEQNRQLTIARAQRIETESLHRMVEDKNAQHLSQVINNTAIAQLKGSLTNLEVEQARSSTTFKPNHPRSLELTQQIAEARRALNHEIGNIVQGIESNFRAARAREQALQAEVNKQQQIALNMKQIGVQYAVLQEEVNVNRTLYESVLKRLSETAVSNDVAVSNMQIVEKGETPLGPSSPQKETNLLFAGALGIFLGVGLALCLEYFDSRVSTPDMVWRVTAKPTLGAVPHTTSLGHFHGGRRHPGVSSTHLPGLNWLRTWSAPENGLLLSDQPSPIIADSFRTIRTALFFSQAAKPPQVILITSASPGEGKTVTTLNLAIALAQGGKSVLVIDADLRRGRCHRAFGLPNHQGLTDVLTGNLAVEESAWQTTVAGLSLLPRGPVPPYPPDLLGSEKMRDVLETLRHSYDLIVIDSPPVTAMADAAVLSALCDGVILVIHGQSTPAGLARQAMERLAVVQARILGVVLNGVDIRNPEYAYYSNYVDSAEEVQPWGNGKPSVETAPEERPSEIKSASYAASTVADRPQNGRNKTVEPAPENPLSEIKAASYDASVVANRPHNASNKTVEPVSEEQTSEIKAASGAASAVGDTPQNGSNKIVEPAPEERPSEIKPASYAASAVVDRMQNDRNNALEPASKDQSSEIKPVLREPRPELVPQEYFDHMVLRLCEAVGPMAPMIVDDQIRSLGESRQAFPKHRLIELLDRVCQEILSESMETDFRRSMRGELSAL